MNHVQFRRRFLQTISMAAIIPCSSRFASAAPSNLDLYDALIGKQYFAPIRLRLISGQYLGNNFYMTASPDLWGLEAGRYQGEFNHRPVDFYGYWIFNPDGQRCWQAVNLSGPLQYWNEDHKATNNPQDWEIFEFVKVSRDASTVKVRNVESKAYVNLVGEQFQCQGSDANATVFIVEFAQNSQVNRFARR